MLPLPGSYEVTAMPYGMYGEEAPQHISALASTPAPSSAAAPTAASAPASDSTPTTGSPGARRLLGFTQLLNASGMHPPRSSSPLQPFQPFQPFQPLKQLAPERALLMEQSVWTVVARLPDGVASLRHSDAFVPWSARPCVLDDYLAQPGSSLGRNVGFWLPCSYT